MQVSDVNMEQENEVFEFVQETLRNAIRETLRYLDKGQMPRNQIERIVFDGLRHNFSVEQIWPKYTKTQQDLLWEELSPEELLELKQAKLIGVCKKANVK